MAKKKKKKKKKTPFAVFFLPKLTQNKKGRLKLEFSNMKSKSRTRITEEANENQRLKSELERTTSEFNQMKVKYEELLKLVDTKDASSSSGISNSISGTYCKDSQSIELQQWNQMWTRCVGMATKVIPFPSVPATSDQEKRAVLTDIVSKLCDIAKHPEQTEEFKGLKKKYSKAKKSLYHLNQRCAQLMDMVHKNAKTLEGYLEDAHTNEKENISQKLEELGEILAEQIRQENALIRESTARKGKLQTAMRSMKKSYINDSDSGDDESESSDSEEEVKRRKHYSSKKYAKKEKKVKASRQQLFSESTDDSSSEDEKKLRKIKQQLSKLGIEDSEESEDEPPRKKKYHAKIKYVDSESCDDSDSADEISNKHSRIVSKQKSYIKEKNASRNISKRYLQASDSDDSSEEEMQHTSVAKSILKTRKAQKISSSETEEEESADEDFKPSKSGLSKSRYVREDAAILNAQLESSSSMKREHCAKCEKINGLRRKYGNNLNKLVGVTNKFGQTYNHMKHQIDSSSDDDVSPSISRISYINDSVVKGKRRIPIESSSDSC